MEQMKKVNTMSNQINSDSLEVGRTYDIRSARHGNFWGTLLELTGEFAKFRIVSGKAKFMAQDDRLEGNTVDIRLSFCKFYPIKEYVPIPPERWGKDHWSTFAYVGTRCVDYKGVLDKSHMRTKRDKHPNLEGESQKRFLSADKEYPTRLRNYFKDKTDCVTDHDDWDCIEDMVAAGLLVKIDEAYYQLTEEGWRVDNLIRQHKAAGNNYASCSSLILRDI